MSAEDNTFKYRSQMRHLHLCGTSVLQEVHLRTPGGPFLTNKNMFLFFCVIEFTPIWLPDLDFLFYILGTPASETESQSGTKTISNSSFGTIGVHNKTAQHDILPSTGQHNSELKWL